MDEANAHGIFVFTIAADYHAHSQAGVMEARVYGWKEIMDRTVDATAAVGAANAVGAGAADATTAGTTGYADPASQGDPWQA